MAVLHVHHEKVDDLDLNAVKISPRSLALKTSTLL